MQSTLKIKKLNLFTDTQLTKKLKLFETLDEHEPDILAILIGNCLGDGSIKKSGKLTASISFSFSKTNILYAEFLHKLYSSRGYCSKKELKILERKRPNGTLYYDIYFNTYAFKSFDILHQMFYRPANKEKQKQGRKFIKKIPNSIQKYLTRQTLAIWYMDDGNFHKIHKNITIATHCFLIEEVLLLQISLKNVFSLDFLIHSTKNNTQHYLYLSRIQVPHFRKLVLEFMIPSMFYKLGLSTEGNPPKEIQYTKHTPNIINGISPLTEKTLADWFSKNGSFNKRDKTITLGTDGITEKEVIQLQMLLKKTFSLEFKIHKKKEQSPCLYLPRLKVPLLTNLIKKHLEPSYHYKLGFSNQLILSSVPEKENLGKKSLLKLSQTKNSPRNSIHKAQNQEFLKTFLIKNEINKQELALWFAKNGSLHKATQKIRLSTARLDRDQVEQLQKILLKTFALSFTLNRHNQTKERKQTWVLSLTRLQLPLFSSTIKKYLDSSLHSKLDSI